MSIKAIGSAALNLPLVSRLSSLIGRINNAVCKNEEAASEAQLTAMTVGAGTVFGLFGRCAVMLALGRFSGSSLLFWGLIGAAAGTAISAYTLYSFYAKFKTREV